MKRWITEMRDGFRILASRKFWRAFRDYYSSAAISRRLDDFAERLRRP